MAPSAVGRGAISSSLRVCAAVQAARFAEGSVIDRTFTAARRLVPTPPTPTSARRRARNLRKVDEALHRNRDGKPDAPRELVGQVVLRLERRQHLFGHLAPTCSFGRNASGGRLTGRGGGVSARPWHTRTNARRTNQSSRGAAPTYQNRRGSTWPACPCLIGRGSPC